MLIFALLISSIDVSAMELALSLEKLTNEKLLNVHSVMPLYLFSFVLQIFVASHKLFDL